MTRQRWDLDAHGLHHRVEVGNDGWRRELRWYVDDRLVAERRSAEDAVTLRPDDDRSDLGSVVLRFTALGRGRRVTWFTAEESAGAGAALGTGGLDLDPEPGSRAARYEARVRAHPRRFQAQRVGVAVGSVLLPILLALVAVRLAVRIPWPDWDLPSIPTPDLPSIPWPGLPDWQLPAWVRWLLEKAKYVWPVALAYVLARRELRRRRQQDERKAALRTADAEDSARDEADGAPGPRT